MSASLPVVIVGAGPAGLACARTLVSAGRAVRVLEASDRPGGRLGSRTVDGIVCDLGFQVSMSNYASLESLVPRREIPRHGFIPGAVVVTERNRARLVDPGREPLSGISAWRHGLVGLRDVPAAAKLRRLAQRVADGGTEAGTGADVLDRCGFSERFRETFLRPFFGGVFLDETLDVPAGRFLRTVHRFATGEAELPDGGMQRLVDGLAGPIIDHVEFGVTAAQVGSGGVTLADGSPIDAAAVVLATPIDVTARLLGREMSEPDTAWRATTAMHFATDTAVLDEPIIVLNGRADGRLNLVCSPTAVASGYAPHGTHTVLASLRPTAASEAAKESAFDPIAIATEAGALLGVDAGSWRHVATTTVRHALPRPGVTPGVDALPSGVHVTGDWIEDPSIDNAVRHGIETAETIIESAA